MNFVEVDAKGLEPKLAIAIAKRALMISCGKPVIITLDSAESKDKVMEFATSRKLSCVASRQEGCFRLEIRK